MYRFTFHLNFSGSSPVKTPCRNAWTTFGISEWVELSLLPLIKGFCLFGCFVLFFRGVGGVN